MSNDRKVIHLSFSEASAGDLKELGERIGSAGSAETITKALGLLKWFVDLSTDGNEIYATKPGSHEVSLLRIADVQIRGKAPILKLVKETDDESESDQG